MNAEQYEEHNETCDPKTHRRSALPKPSRTESAGKQEKG